jgi:hypothetical protein
MHFEIYLALASMTKTERLCPSCQAPIPSGITLFMPGLKLTKNKIVCSHCHAVLHISSSTTLMSFVAAVTVVAGEILLIRQMFAGQRLAGGLPFIGACFVVFIIPMVSFQLVSAAVCRRFARLFVLPFGFSS